MKLKNNIDIKKYITPKNYLAIILVIALFFLVVPHLVRFMHTQNFLIPGEAAYRDIAVIDRISEKPFEIYLQMPLDELIVPTRPIVVTPYHYLMGWLGKVFSTHMLSLLLLIILGVASLLLLDQILSVFKLSCFKRFLILLMFTFSPLFLNTFLIPSQAYFIIFLQFFGFYLYTKQESAKYLSVLPYLLLSFFSVLHVILAIIAIMAYELNIGKKYRFALLLSLAMLCLTLSYNLPVYYQYGFLKTHQPSDNLLQVYISDFGSPQGFGLFTVVLVFFGLISTWNEKYSRKNLLIYAGLILFILSSYYYPQFMIYLNIMASLLAGLGLLFLIEMEWDIDMIKSFTILIIVLGLLFSGVSFVKRVSLEQPNDNMLEALTWIKQTTPQGSIVLSSPEYGNLIKYYAERKVLIDSYQEFIYDYDYYLGLEDTVFSSRSLKETTEILKQKDISLILITEEMKKGLVWDKEEQGLLFLLENTDAFKMIHRNPTVEVWAVTVRGSENV